MKIYTRTGDGGETGLFGGPRVSKDDPRVEAYGAVDEASAALGEARSRARAAGEVEIEGLLAAVQDRLFTLGAELATPADAKAHGAVPPIEDGWVSDLEGAMDRWEAELPPLRHFILPGGAPLACALHLARAVCRRAERRAVTLHRTAPFDARVVVYLNRLSDFLFVAARVANARAGHAETTWDPRRRP